MTRKTAMLIAMMLGACGGGGSNDMQSYHIPDLGHPESPDMVCVPQCQGKSCGNDGCGGTCGTCPSGQTCGTNGTCQSGGGTCAHPLCSTGSRLKKSCDPCATQICSQDPYCCSVKWDAVCVGEVGSICGETCQ